MHLPSELRLLFAFLTAAACRSSVTELEPDPDLPLEAISLTTARDLDLLVVVDDSGSMRQEQQALARGFDRLIAPLADADGNLPGLHIGVVSSNVGTAPLAVGEQCAGEGDDGALLVRPECAALTDSSPFIKDLPAGGGEREVNYAGTLAEQFGCMAQLGTQGCGFEQHFESMRRALDGREVNEGFLRPAASLAVLFVADEDDCSAHDRMIFDPSMDDRTSLLGELSSFRCFEFGVECAATDGGERALGSRADCAPEDDSPYIEPVSSYVDFLRGLKSDPETVFVAAITGDPGPVAVAEDVEKTPPELIVSPTCTICPGGAASGCTTGEALVSAAPAIRMQGLVDAFGAAGHRQDICAYDPATDSLDFGAALTGVAERLAPLVATECLAARPLDRDPAAAGLQADCELIEAAGASEVSLPACDGGGGNTPCFRLRESPDRCPASGLALAIDRGQAAPPTAPAHSLRCVLPD